MSSTFAKIVEEVKFLSVGEKQELRELIEKYLIEERREEIFDSYAESLTELREGKLEFSEVDLETAYRQMAEDESRESEALEWAEATIGDSSDETR